MFYLRKIISLAASIALVASCVKPDPKGCVQLSILDETSVSEGELHDLSEYTTVPTFDGFDVRVSQSGKQLWAGKYKDWNTSSAAADMPVSDNLKAEAWYGDPEAEGFDKPYIAGSADFAFEWSDITVGVPVKLSNSLVRISTSELFDSYYHTYEFVITTAAGTKVLFGKGETRAAFVAPGSVSVEASLTDAQGHTETLGPKQYDNLQSSTCHNLTFDLSGIGGHSLEIIFDDEIENVDLGEILVDSGEGLLDLGSLCLSCETLTKAVSEAPDDYIVTVADSRGAALSTMTYAESKALEGGLALPVGNYSITVRSTETPVPAAGFDCPAYGATLPFKIAAGQTTELGETLVCRLLQTMVSVSFDSAFLSRVTADSKVTLKLSNGKELEYTLEYNNGKPALDRGTAYFLTQQQGLTLEVDFNGYIDSRAFSTSRNIGELKPATWRKISFGL